MKKLLKKTAVIVLAVVFAAAIHITVSAASATSGILPNLSSFEEFIQHFLNPTTTTTEPNGENTTASTPGETTTLADGAVSTSGQGSVTTTVTTQVYTAAPTQYTPATVVTDPVTTTIPEEDSSQRGGSSLADILEQDNAQVIVQAPTEPYTIAGPLVSNQGGNSDSFSWQTVALVAAAVLFVVLAALVAALIIQRSKNSHRDAGTSRISTSSPREDSSPVEVEVMTPERIAELLGKASQDSGRLSDISEMSGAESAAAIKNAVLLGQLSHSYSDPLIKKYTDDPVVFSPQSGLPLDAENMTSSEVLKATDSLLKSITGGTYLSETEAETQRELEDILSDSKGKTCPECGKPVSDTDVFCHNCGAYTG